MRNVQVEIDFIFQLILLQLILFDLFYSTYFIRRILFNMFDDLRTDELNRSQG